MVDMFADVSHFAILVKRAGFDKSADADLSADLKVLAEWLSSSIDRLPGELGDSGKHALIQLNSTQLLKHIPFAVTFIRTRRFTATLSASRRRIYSAASGSSASC